MVKRCCFCEEYKCASNSQYYEELGQKVGIESRILIESEHWYAVPTLGCLTIGYVLLICKQHFQSTANLNIELYNEMLELKAIVEETIYEKLGLKCLTFEHGSTSELYSSAKSVDHVHLHIIPFAKEIWSDISREHNLNGFSAVANYNELVLLWANSFPKTYLLFQDTNGIIHYNSNAQGFPSQFFRKCLAPYLNAEEWDWRKDYHEDNFIRTVNLFR